MAEISKTMGVSMEAAQATLTAYMVPFGLMTLWHGALSDAFGRKRIMLIGLSLFLAASIGCSIAPSLGWLLVFRALQGATVGVGMVIGRAIVRDLYDGASAQRLMAMVAIVFAIAPAISPLIGGWLHHWFGWRSVFIFMAVYTAGLLAYTARNLPETLAPEKRQPFHPGYLTRSYLSALTNPFFMAVCIALTFASSGLFVYVFSAPIFLMQHLHVEETAFLWLFGPMTAGIVLGNGISAKIAGKLSLIKSAALGCAIMLFATAGNVVMNLLMAPRLPWAVVPVFGYMVGMSIIIPPLTIKAIDCFPEKRGLAASCQSFLQSAGNSIVSFSVQLVWATSLSLSLAQMSLALTSSCIVAAILFVHARKTSQVPVKNKTAT
jgi:DHA1 family bicyclomycin/chloramphenicol resistance-like MFS transporter